MEEGDGSDIDHHGEEHYKEGGGDVNRLRHIPNACKCIFLFGQCNVNGFYQLFCLPERLKMASGTPQSIEQQSTFVQLKEEQDAVTDQSLERTRNMVRMVEESQVLEMLKKFCNNEERRDQLDMIVGKLDEVNAEMEDIKESEGLYIKRITNDAREEEMEKNMQAVSSVLFTLKEMMSQAMVNKKTT